MFQFTAVLAYFSTFVIGSKLNMYEKKNFLENGSVLYCIGWEHELSENGALTFYWETKSDSIY